MTPRKILSIFMSIYFYSLVIQTFYKLGLLTEKMYDQECGQTIIKMIIRALRYKIKHSYS